MLMHESASGKVRKRKADIQALVLAELLANGCRV
jgi:hypothetical protein